MYKYLSKFFLNFLEPVPTQDPLEETDSDILQATRRALKVPDNRGTVSWAKATRDEADLVPGLRAEIEALKLAKTRPIITTGFPVPTFEALASAATRAPEKTILTFEGLGSATIKVPENISVQIKSSAAATFGSSEVNHTGHLIDEEGLQTLSQKVADIACEVSTEENRGEACDEDYVDSRFRSYDGVPPSAEPAPIGSLTHTARALAEIGIHDNLLEGNLFETLRKVLDRVKQQMLKNRNNGIVDPKAQLAHDAVRAASLNHSGGYRDVGEPRYSGLGNDWAAKAQNVLYLDNTVLLDWHDSRIIMVRTGRRGEEATEGQYIELRQGGFPLHDHLLHYLGEKGKTQSDSCLTGCST